MNCAGNQKNMKRAREGGAKRDRNSEVKKHPFSLPRAVAHGKFLKSHDT
jgi:hypothetical protein